MVKNKTLIVLGAGSSEEVGLPIGSELKDQIARILDFPVDYNFAIENEIKQALGRGDQQILHALRIWHNQFENVQSNSFPINFSDLIYMSWAIRDAMPQATSIDSFIDAHSGNEVIEICGKLAIVRTILFAERKSSLYVGIDGESPNIDYNKIEEYWFKRSNIDFKSIEETWFIRLFQIVFEGCKRDEDLDNLRERLSSLSFVIFNYDRCLEHFLYYSLTNYYGFNLEIAAELVREVEIYHPYGQVGSLPWQEGNNNIGFGTNVYPELLVKLSSQIRTFSEGTDSQSSEIESIRQSYWDSSIILYLGFAFHRLNMELLAGDRRIIEQPKKCFATAWEMSIENRVLIEKDMQKLAFHNPSDVHVENLKCNDLIGVYSRYLRIE